MNIYLYNQYEYIKEDLKNRGYNVVQDKETICDAVICDLKNCDIKTMSSEVTLKREGAIIVDCGSKNIDDIDYILNNRSYSSLF